MNIIPIIRDNYIKRDGTAPIYLQLFIMKKKITVPVGVAVSVDDWDYMKRIVRKKNKNADDYNLIIKQGVGKVNSILIKYRLMEKNITPEKFRDEFKNPSVYIDFYSWMEKEIFETRDSTISINTAKDHLTALNQVFRKFRKELAFSEINEELVENFIKYVKRRYSNLGTQYSKIKVLKKYTRIAVKRGIIREDPFRSIKLKQTGNSPEYLDEEELIKLCELYKNDKHLLTGSNEKILRHFLFSCMTGLRISDLKSLDHDHIINKLIVKQVVKTRRVKGELVKIPLSKSALNLIRDENHLRLHGKVFELNSEPTINKKLKEIAKIVNIEKNISTKIARHTFATLFLKHNPGDIATLQKLLGHSRIEQTLIYVHISDAWKKDRMKAFDNYI